MIIAYAWASDSATLECECGYVFLGQAEGEGSSQRKVAPELAAEIVAHHIHAHGDWLIICRGTVRGEHSSRQRPAAHIPQGQYLEDYRPDAMGGYGMTAWTIDPARAMRFAGEKAARDAWATSSVRKGRSPSAVYAVEFIPALLTDTGPAEPGTEQKETP
jgi:hypothetical protein